MWALTQSTTHFDPNFSSWQMLNIIQNHYPERLGRAIVINVPFLINAFFKIIMPFVDPITREKVKFNPDVLKEGFFTKENLMTQWWGGDREFEWDHDQYWPALVKMCEERRQTQKMRWKDMGATIGLDEWKIKGGETETVEAASDSKPITNGQETSFEKKDDSPSIIN